MRKPPASLEPELLVRKREAQGSHRPPSPPAKEHRRVITTRLLEHHDERLRELAFKDRVTKQALLDAALEDYLKKRGA
jgi:hypothetical protein